MSKKSKVIGAIVVVLVIGGVAAGFAVSGAKTTSVEVADVTNEKLSIVVSASGKVEASDRIDVYPPTTGTIASIEVTDGAEVKAGQVLAVMDTAPIEVQVAQAEAAYKGAVAQRNTITSSAPGSAAVQAAQAAADAANAAYSAANAAYDAAKSGAGVPSASDIAQAQAAVAAAAASAQAAQGAYDSFYTTVYLPAPLPRSATLESTLASLSMARDQAVASLGDAQRALATLQGASNTTATIASAKLARDQAYAAYLAAVSQRDALVKSSNVAPALASANAAISAAESALAYARDTLARARITAPADGVVLFAAPSAASMLSAAGGSSAGGKLTAGSAVSPASAAFSIVGFDTLAFSAQVDETDVARVQPGMKALVSLDGIAGEEFAATVDRIGKESVMTSTGGTAFPVRLLFASNGKPVLIGMNGSAEIEVETIGSALTMPVEALLEEGDTSYVYVVRNGRASRTEIKTGRITDTRAEVLSGLKAGDSVIVSGVADLTDGARVRAK